MMPVVVVVPLDAVKNGSRADHPKKTNSNSRREQGGDEASSRAACGHSPKT